MSGERDKRLREYISCQFAQEGKLDNPPTVEALRFSVQEYLKLNTTAAPRYERQNPPQQQQQNYRYNNPGQYNQPDQLQPPANKRAPPTSDRSNRRPWRSSSPCRLKNSYNKSGNSHRLNLLLEEATTVVTPLTLPRIAHLETRLKSRYSKQNPPATTRRDLGPALRTLPAWKARYYTDQKLTYPSV